jgi:hypothetical protein
VGIGQIKGLQFISKWVACREINHKLFLIGATAFRRRGVAMFKPVWIVLGLSVGLIGCQTVSVPVSRKLDANIACGPLANRGCAPSQGTAFALKKQYKIIEVNADTKEPDYLSYVGTIVKRNMITPASGKEFYPDRLGDPGAACGAGVATPFTADDVTKSVYSNSYKIEYELDQRAEGSFKADLAESLKTAGVPVSTIAAAKADIDAAASQLKKVKIVSTGTFRQVQLKASVLHSLEASASPLGECFRELKTGDWRMYSAVSGIYVTEGTIDSNAKTNILAKLSASISERNGSAIAGLDAALDRKVSERINASIEPYFAVIGVSYWISPRHPEIIN